MGGTRNPSGVRLRVGETATHIAGPKLGVGAPTVNAGSCGEANTGVVIAL